VANNGSNMSVDILKDKWRELGFYPPPEDLFNFPDATARALGAYAWGHAKGLSGNLFRSAIAGMYTYTTEATHGNLAVTVASN
jgi:hypothetical protein